MERGLRILGAVGILLGGIAVATLFRPSAPRGAPPEGSPQDRLVLREPSKLPEVRPLAADPPTAKIEGSAIASRRLAMPGRSSPGRAPMDSSESPPVLARSYPPSAHRMTSGWNGSTGREAPTGKVPGGPVATHKIVDGDTLGLLAERYLGDADRFLEIYNANRHLLARPDILPIGVDLEIPVQFGEAPVSPRRVPERPLVPIPPGRSEGPGPQR